MSGSFRTTWAGRLAAVSVLVGAIAAILGGNINHLDVPGVLEALSMLGLGGSLAWLGFAAKDEKDDKERK